MRKSHLDLGAASAGTKLHQQKHQDPAVQIQELLRLNGHLFECSPELSEEAANLLTPSIGPGNRILIGRDQLEVGPRITERGIPVAAAYRVIYGAKRLDVCIRHRARSIPQAGWRPVV